MVHSVRNGDYSQHQGYFNSFSSVNPQIKNHPEAERALKIYLKTRQLTQQIPSKLFPSQYYTEPEEQVMRHVLLAIQKDSEQILTELEELLQEGRLQMSDTDRLKQLTGMNHRMQEVYGYTVRFYQDCQDISLSRQNESQAIRQHHQLKRPERIDAQCGRFEQELEDFGKGLLDPMFEVETPFCTFKF